MNRQRRIVGFGIAAMLLLVLGTSAREASAQEIQVSGGLDEVNVYVADGGDTLWDIADRFFQDPWYWPVLWSFNPHITNPNWIFPGDRIFLVPPKPQVRVREGYSVTESRYSAGPQVERALGRRVGFISDEDLKGSGRISNSREEKNLLSETDEAYIRFDTVRRIREGDLFLVFRVEGRIKHPVTRKKMGYKIRYLGVSKVTSTETDLNKAVLLSSFEEIERNDRVAPFAPVQRSVPPVRNATDVQGTIVTTFDDVENLGEYHYAIIDRGSKDGVMAGNRFLVREKGDGVAEFNPKPKKRKDFPMETLGEIIVIEAYEKTSLGIVTYANREIRLGAGCEMLAGY